MNALLKALIARRDETTNALTHIAETVATENRTALSAAEDASAKALKATLDEVEPQIAYWTELEGRDAAHAELVKGLPVSSSAGGAGPIVKVGPDLEYREGRGSFFADLYRSQVLREPSAAQRIDRHREQMDRMGLEQFQGRELPGLQGRDLAVSALAGVIPPAYLVDMFAPLARQGRPVANTFMGIPLPADGVSFIIPRGTTGTSADSTAEGSAFSETDAAVTDLTITVNAITSQQDISRTLFMRGGGADALLFADMQGAYSAVFDARCIYGTGTAPQHRGLTQVASINAVTYTDLSPTVTEAMPKIADAIQQINSNRYLPATCIVMHPRRWGWFTAAVDTTGRPLIPSAQNAPQNAFGVGEAAKYGQVVGQLFNLPVVTSANVPTNLGAGTNEDIIIIYRASDVVLWEEGDGSALQFTFQEAIGPEKVRLAAIGFTALAAGRYPKSIATIGGTGFVTPTF